MTSEYIQAQGGRAYDLALAALRYLHSIDVRSGTLAPILIGFGIGAIVVVTLLKHPGQPVDYSSIGAEFEVPLHMQGARRDGRSPSSMTTSREVAVAQGGEVEHDTLRRRRPAGPTSQDLQTCDGNATPEFDADKLDEDKIAQTYASSKVSKLLGITDEQVREAVRDAKRELREEGAGGAAPVRRGGRPRSSIIPYVDAVVYMVLLGVLFYILRRDHGGVVTRFLTGIFPKEMAVLGIQSPRQEHGGPDKLQQ